ncbi:MAG TPA: GNAT family N-acetyltransferase [Victivallales bacterium]|nr:GNAT family N-acetyltransferase [Victivallales bacterium]
MILETDRLQLINLSLEQLEFIPNKIAELEKDLDCTEIKDLLDAPILKAIGIKVKILRKISLHDHPWLTYWLVLDKNSKTALGFFGFKGYPDENGETEVGYGVSPNYRRQGIAGESLSVLTKWAFSKKECCSITASEVLNTNLGSQKVLRKCGFKQISENNETCNWILNKKI